MSALIGEVRLFAGDFVPRGWLLCDGRQYHAITYPPLFSVLGGRYGGDGRSTFAVPDLRGRAPIGTGAGNSLSKRSLGDILGVEEVSLTEAQLPGHRHEAHALDASATSLDPGGRYAARPNPQVGGIDLEAWGLGGQRRVQHVETIGVTGGGQPHANMQPSFALHFIICYEGILPPDPALAGPIQDPAE